MSTSILIVDDDPHIREVIGFALQNAGFTPHQAENGLAALAHISAHPPALMILDIGLPELDGLEVCRQVRKSSTLPILFLTARDEEVDRVIGLELGGDDYVTKPFSPRELVARVKAILKRVAPHTSPASGLKLWGDLSLDPDRYQCSFAGEPVHLTATEFLVLSALIAVPQNVLSRQQLLDTIYGHNIHVSDRTVDSHIRNIRAKLAKAGCMEAISTVHGVGLRLGTCRKA